MEDKQTGHRNQHHNHADTEERFRGHLAQNERTQEATCRTEDKIKTRSKSGLIKRHANTFHQNLWSSGICTDIDTHMTHDSDKAKQDKRFAKQCQTLTESGRSAFFFLFLNLRGVEQEYSNDGHYHVNREKYTPAEAERRNSLRSSPHSDIWSEERGYCFHKLSESEAACQAVATDNVGKKRVQ